MPRPAHCALHQQMSGAGRQRAAAVALLEAERDTEVSRLVDRHHRYANLPGELGENRIRLA
jgi:hypothetical protein